MAAIPAWKQALLDRKKKQEEEEKKNLAKAEEAKLASLPPWKRAIILREKQAQDIGLVESNSPVLKRVASSILQNERKTIEKQQKGESKDAFGKWQTAVERVKGADSPILNKKPSLERRVSSLNYSSDSKSSPKQQAKLSSQSFSGGSPRLANKNLVLNRWSHVMTNGHSDTCQKMPREKNSSVSTSSAPIATSPPRSRAHDVTTNAHLDASTKMPREKNSSSSAPIATSPPRSHARVSSRQDEEDPSLAGLPAWKKALILKKRQQQQKPESSASKNEHKENSQLEGEDETDAPSKRPAPVTKIASKQSSTISKSEKQPEVINKSEGEKSESGNLRLIEQEGKTLHAPIYKEVEDQWANVNEEDKKFKDLPLWKQALIKRRRRDIAKRSGLPVTITETLPVAETSAKDVKEVTRTDGKKQPSRVSKSKVTTEKSKITSKRSVGGKSASKNISTVTDKSKNEQKAKAKVDSAKVILRPTKSRDSKPARKAPLPPTLKKEEPEPMFTYSFSKSTHHTLDTGGSASDSTDSDLEEAVITNLDESSSDEGDSGIVLKSYTTSEKLPDTDMKRGSVQKSESSDDILNKSKSVLKKPGKKKKVSLFPTPKHIITLYVIISLQHLRRVSWSDSALISEYYYPKYNYSDYEEIHEETPQISSHENSGLSQRLHPSLRLSNDTNSDPYHYGYSPSASPKSGSSESSLANFIPSSLSSYSPRILANYSDPIESSDAATEEAGISITGSTQMSPTNEVDTDDFYAGLTSNTAALLW